MQTFFLTSFNRGRLGTTASCVAPRTSRTHAKGYKDHGPKEAPKANRPETRLPSRGRRPRLRLPIKWASSEPLWMSEPPSPWITLRTSCSANLPQVRLFVHIANDLSTEQPHIVHVILDGSFRQAGLGEVKEEGHECTTSLRPGGRTLLVAVIDDSDRRANSQEHSGARTAAPALLQGYQFRCEWSNNITEAPVSFSNHGAALHVSLAAAVDSRLEACPDIVQEAYENEPSGGPAARCCRRRSGYQIGRAHV